MSQGGPTNLSTPVLVGTRRNPEATIYVGELDTQVDEEILWELFLQIGPVVHVHIPKDKVTNQHQGFGFVEFAGELDADYACKVMGGVKLFGKPIRCNKASPQKRGIVTYDVGANLFIGNLSPEVDERLLYDTFSRFGVIVATPKIMREESNESKGYAFISFGDFESSDGAIAALNGQYLAGRPISVAYAIKKDSKGERHGSEAERMLAHQKRIAQGVPQQVQRPQAAMAPVSSVPPTFAPPPPPQFQRPPQVAPPPFPGQQQFMRPPPQFAPPPPMQFQAPPNFPTFPQPTHSNQVWQRPQ